MYVIYFDRPSITIPPCPDQCSTTYCSACYYSDTAVSTPSLCNNICKYPPTRRCLFKWSICLRTYSIFVSLYAACMYMCDHIPMHSYVLLNYFLLTIIQVYKHMRALLVIYIHTYLDTYIIIIIIVQYNTYVCMYVCMCMIKSS